MTRILPVLVLLTSCADSPNCTNYLHRQPLDWCTDGRPILRTPESLDPIDLAGVILGALIGGAMRP